MRLPDSLPHTSIEIWKRSRLGESHRHRMIGNLAFAVVRHITYRYSTLRCGFHIDVVVANANPDYDPAPTKALDNFPGHPEPCHQKHLCLGNAVCSGAIGSVGVCKGYSGSDQGTHCLRRIICNGVCHYDSWAIIGDQYTSS